jgi:hypothetical protein
MPLVSVVMKAPEQSGSANNLDQAVEAESQQGDTAR